MRPATNSLAPGCAIVSKDDRFRNSRRVTTGAPLTHRFSTQAPHVGIRSGGSRPAVSASPNNSHSRFILLVSGLVAFAYSTLVSSAQRSLSLGLLLLRLFQFLFQHHDPGIIHRDAILTYRDDRKIGQSPRIASRTFGWARSTRVRNQTRS